MKRQSPGLPIPDDWNGTSWCHFSISWPDSLNWRAILAGFITTPMLGRTWDADTGTITDVQEIGREILEKNLDWRYALVSTCDQMDVGRLITALNGIAASIRAASCCAPGNGIGYVDVDGELYYGTEQPIEKPTTFGEGEEFPSEAAFSTHLCNAANNIVSGLILSLNNWSVLTVASLVAGGLIIAFFVATPPVALFLAMGALGFAFALFAAAADYISEHREEWVCAIYSATNYSDMLVRIDSLVNDLVIELDVGPFSVQLTDLIHAMINTDTLNKAYTNVNLPAPIGAVSCDECNPASCADMGQTWNLESTLEEGNYWVRVDSNVLAGYEDYLDCCWIVTSIGSFSGYTAPGSGISAVDYSYCNNKSGSRSGYWEADASTWDPGDDEYNWFSIRSSTAFTVTITLENV